VHHCVFKCRKCCASLSPNNLLIKDLDKELTEAATTEVDAQADYEQIMRDSAEKRVADSKSLSGKEATKADTEAKLITLKEVKKGTTKELASPLEVISATHAECYWLLKYFNVRKEARTGEIDSLVQANTVLSSEWSRRFPCADIKS